MKGAYRSRSRLAMDLLSAIQADGPVGVTRLLLVANLTHAKLRELVESFEESGWIKAESEKDRSLWVLTPEGARILADLRRIDAAMKDYGLGL